MQKKNCPKCEREKDTSAFNKNKNGKDGLNSICRECQKVLGKIWYRKNSEKVIANSKKWYRKNKQRRKKTDKALREKLMRMWEVYFKEKHGEFSCECCGVELTFNKSNHKTAIHWDHRFGNEAIRTNPTSWLWSHKCSLDNRDLWDSCNFGMLCKYCNFRVGEPEGREERLYSMYRYAKQEEIT